MIRTMKEVTAVDAQFVEEEPMTRFLDTEIQHQYLPDMVQPGLSYKQLSNWLSQYLILKKNFKNLNSLLTTVSEPHPYEES